MKPYLQLIKMNITILVVITSYLGYYLGLRYENLMMIEYESWIVFLYLVVGTFISSSGACILNQYFEVEYDKKMERTKLRPLPTKEIDLNVALILGVLLSFLGPYILLQINPLTSLISFLTIFIYIVIYTPLKRFSSINTIVGAVPGALPPLGGWVAATNQINLEGMLLFGILFCWQIPHFLSLAIIYKRDYERGGFKMLPVIAKNSNTVNFQIIFFTMALIYSSIGIYILNLTSFIYVFGAVVLGLIFLVYSSMIIFDQSSKTVKNIFIFSIIYLPSLLVLILIDSFF
ncbi:MAG: protoheme IX farnesyltransferase [Candidatus Marinimicrobia bacterium]|nr:protoheme IX farnesyltransferase [Candidatus Neomarinimicrobiota bacterium]|tara:strand:+ start:35968 stop:36834 length:867 start_codon:yes stop_codon:yes gene_type:complete